VERTDRLYDLRLSDDRTYGNDFGHLLGFNGPITVHVIHLECPLELLLRLPCRGDVDCQQELLEVDLAAVVRVERAEHVLAELVGVTLREEAGIDFEELGSCQLSTRTISLYIHPHVSIAVTLKTESLHHKTTVLNAEYSVHDSVSLERNRQIISEQ